MYRVVEFLTSQTGVIAALTAVVVLVGGVVGLVHPVMKARQERADARPRLRFSTVLVENPPPHSEAGHVSFELLNSGGGKAVLRDLLLRVCDHGRTELPKMTEVAAPVPVFTYKVTLDPSVTEYDVRKKAFGTSPQHAYDRAEVESFEIELRSTEPQWYEFEIIVRWYDVARPTDVQELRTGRQRIEFLPDVADLL